jgi:hypothetical protein
MDDDDSTEALLVKLIEGEHVIDNAIANLYDDERAWGLSAIVGDILNINADSDDPPFEHNTPSALSGNKRSLPLHWTTEQQPSSNNYSGAMCEVSPSLWRHLTHQRSHNITEIPGGCSCGGGGGVTGAVRCVRCRHLFGGTSHINAGVP